MKTVTARGERAERVTSALPGEPAHLAPQAGGAANLLQLLFVPDSYRGS